MYIGFSYNESGIFTFKDVSYYTIENKIFQKESIKDYFFDFIALERILQQEYVDLFDNGIGGEISILVELEKGRWFPMIWIMNLGIITIFERIAGNICHTDIKSAQWLKANVVMHDMTTPIYSLFKKVGYINTMLFWNPSLNATAATFFDSHYPSIYFWRNKKSDDTDFNTCFYTIDELIPSVKYMYNDLFDFGIIYSGNPILVDRITDAHKNTTTITPSVQSYFQNFFAEDIDTYFVNDQKPLFYERFIDSTDNAMLNSYGDVMWGLSLEILYHLLKLYENGYKQKYMRAFTQALNRVRYANMIIREPSESFVSCIRKLSANLPIKRDYIALLPTNTMIMGGGIVFAMPFEWFRKELTVAIEETQKEYPWLELLYASRQDGVEWRWLIFEQDREQWLYSKFIDAKQHRRTNPDGTTTIGDYEKLTNSVEYDILLDKIHDKVFMQGLKVSSLDLHSQKTTVEILSQLVENRGERISNKDLPPSSYAKNKNDMIGKVFTPFVRMIKSKLGKDIKLECKGSLSTFSMMLDLDDVYIAVLDRIQRIRKPLPPRVIKK